jgi:WD40 repeat protein
VKALLHIAISVMLLALVSTASLAEDEYGFEIERRINAHGDEFMALAQTSDGRYLIIGTESGKLIVWGIAERRILRQLDQGSAVHCLVALSDPDTFVAAGGPHAGHDNRPVIRKWRISTGESEEWTGLKDGSIFSLAFDPASNLVAAGTMTGQLAVWNSGSGKIVTKRSLDSCIMGLTINKQEIYLTKFKIDEEEEGAKNAILRLLVNEPKRPPTEFSKQSEDKLWTDVKLSPDARYLAAHFASSSARGVVLLDRATGKELSTFESRSFAWSRNGQLVLFDGEVATERVSMDARGQVSRSELFKEAQWHSSGSPANMTAQVISADGSTAWEVFQIGASLVELDLNKKSFDQVYSLSGYLHTMDVREPLNLIATGGDDEFVRVRRLSDLSFVKEFKAAPGVPQGVALMDDGRHIVFSASSDQSPTRISIGDLGSGQSRTLLEVPEPFVGVQAAAGGFIYKRANSLVLAKWTDGSTVREYAVDGDLAAYAVSVNGKWLVASNNTGHLFRFQIVTGTRTNVGAESISDLTRLTITNDGRYVYTTEFGAALKQWDTQTKAMKQLAVIRGQARTLRLSRDEKEITIGGNHRDVAVYETATGERRLYFEIAAADFYVTNVWLGGDRILFSTDAGVLFDGWVKR